MNWTDKCKCGHMLAAHFQNPATAHCLAMGCDCKMFDGKEEPVEYVEPNCTVTCPSCGATFDTFSANAEKA